MRRSDAQESVQSEWTLGQFEGGIRKVQDLGRGLLGRGGHRLDDGAQEENPAGAAQVGHAASHRRGLCCEWFTSMIYLRYASLVAAWYPTEERKRSTALPRNLGRSRSRRGYECPYGSCSFELDAIESQRGRLTRPPAKPEVVVPHDELTNRRV